MRREKAAIAIKSRFMLIKATKEHQSEVQQSATISKIEYDEANICSWYLKKSDADDKAALNPFTPQPVLMLRVALTHVQDLALGPVEPHEVHMGPLLQLVQGPLKDTLKAEQPQLSQPVFTGEVFQPSDHLRGPPLDLLQQVHVLLMLGVPELKAVLQVGSHKSEVERENHLPRPAGHTSFDAAQDTVGFLGCKGTLSGHVELLINQYPQVLLLRAALNPFSAQPVFVLGIAPTHVQDFAFGLVELHEVRTGPALKPVKVPLDGIPSLQHVDCTTQIGVISRLTEGALNPTVHVADKDVKHCRSQYRPLRNATPHWSPLGYRATGCNTLSVTIQPIPYPPSGPSLKSMPLQCRDKDVVQDSVKCFAQVQVTVPSTRVHTGVPACPVQQHRNSSDALAICQPTRTAIAVINMFPGTAE
ncbi:hypothetical protein QYF61_015443 [Mycteria americana]|uniref:Uncharacterized protein n=1 Tax=Mycteria americana TaxID=33587 RepID=A0AAN7S7J1_MYCAM|nr:hypothetical protein QYF61_015443 [Mycteria americana]